MAARLKIATLEEDGRRVFVLRGELHPESARELAEQVLQDGAEELVLDFTRMETIEDRALGILAQLVCCSGRRIGLRGLRDRHFRLLEWLGAEQPQR